jgi:hypothetical protein
MNDSRMKFHLYVASVGYRKLLGQKEDSTFSSQQMNIISVILFFKYHVSIITFVVNETGQLH